MPRWDARGGALSRCLTDDMVQGRFDSGEYSYVIQSGMPSFTYIRVVTFAPSSL